VGSWIHWNEVAGLFLLVSLLAAAASRAQDQTGRTSPPKARPVTTARIAVVDLTKVFSEHPEAVKAQELLNKERSEMREVFKEKSEALKKALQRHQEEIRAEKKDAAVETLEEVNTLEKDIAAMRSTQQRALEERFAEEKTRVLGLIRDAVAAHNADGRYDLVLDSSAASANGLPAVLDARGAHDITAEIIARVQAEKKQKIED